MYYQYLPQYLTNDIKNPNNNNKQTYTQTNKQTKNSISSYNEIESYASLNNSSKIIFFDR